MAVLRWFLPRENSDIIERTIMLKIFAGLFVCGKFLVAGRRGRRPLHGCAKILVLPGYLLNPKNIFYESSLPTFLGKRAAARKLTNLFL